MSGERLKENRGIFLSTWPTTGLLPIITVGPHFIKSPNSHSTIAVRGPHIPQPPNQTPAHQLGPTIAPHFNGPNSTDGSHRWPFRAEHSHVPQNDQTTLSILRSARPAFPFPATKSASCPHSSPTDRHRASERRIERRSKKREKKPEELRRFRRFERSVDSQQILQISISSSDACNFLLIPSISVFNRFFPAFGSSESLSLP